MSELKVKVALGDRFLMAFAAIPRQKQRAVMSFVTRFRENPLSTGINYELIRNANDPNFRSVRIDKDYRGIVLKPDHGNVYVLLWVAKHDDAYKWAQRHRCSINPNTGALQLFEIDLAQETVSDDVVSSSPIDFNHKEITKPLFDLSDDVFLKLGVPAEKLELVKGFSSEVELENAESKLPIEAFEALYLYAAGTDLEEILNDYATDKSEKINTEDFVTALENPISKRLFFVPEDEQELGRMLNAPLERWRVFLHPSQRKLVERNWNGPVRVLGGAGTGKTVVAMHRARWLVSQKNWPANAKLLFTTFTSNLVTDIKENLKKICSPEDMQKIEVIHLDAWVGQYVRSLGYKYRIVYPNDGVYKNCWNNALALVPNNLNLHEQFYEEEWQRVVLQQKIRSRQQYLLADRKGRGVSLNRKQRAEIWPVFEEMYEQLMRQSVVTIEDAIFFAIENIRNLEKHKYISVVCDEGQDLSPNSLELIRALVPEKENDIFIVGDAHQRIYQHRASMKQCGINIIGRGRKLRINYRTTELIRRFATALLENQAIDDLDGGIDKSNDYRSLVLGQFPVIKSFESLELEKEWLIQQVNKLTSQGLKLSDICLVLRTNKLCEDYIEILKKAGIEVHKISRKVADNRNTPGLRIATMHRVKGLEFKTIFIASVNEGIVPLSYALSNTLDVVEKQLSELNERALFHVAATRAVSHLFISSYGETSSFLSK